MYIYIYTYSAKVDTDNLQINIHLYAYRIIYIHMGYQLIRIPRSHTFSAKRGQWSLVEASGISWFIHGDTEVSWRIGVPQIILNWTIVVLKPIL